VQRFLIIDQKFSYTIGYNPMVAFGDPSKKNTSMKLLRPCLVISNTHVLDEIGKKVKKMFDLFGIQTHPITFNH
jgi:hypothetical protein